MFGSFGWMELLLILIIVLIIFGAGKLPQLGEGLGKAIKGFKKTVHEPESVDLEVPKDPPAPSKEENRLGTTPSGTQDPVHQTHEAQSSPELPVEPPELPMKR